MEVLVVESEPGAAAIAIAQLEAAGHRVTRCHEPGQRPFPCVGLDPGRCPLENDAIDVELTVRARTNPRPSPLEDGVTCVLRHHAPVVAAGRTTINPFAQYSVTDTGGRRRGRRLRTGRDQAATRARGRRHQSTRVDAQP